jgi:hypothetical protein
MGKQSASTLVLTTSEMEKGVYHTRNAWRWSPRQQSHMRLLRWPRLHFHQWGVHLRLRLSSGIKTKDNVLQLFPSRSLSTRIHLSPSHCVLYETCEHTTGLCLQSKKTPKLKH